MLKVLCETKDNTITLYTDTIDEIFNMEEDGKFPTDSLIWVSNGGPYIELTELYR